MSKKNRQGIYGIKELFIEKKKIVSDITTLSEYDNFYNPSTMRHYGKVDLSGNIVYLSETFLDTLKYTMGSVIKSKYPKKSRSRLEQSPNICSHFLLPSSRQRCSNHYKVDACRRNVLGRRN